MIDGQSLDITAEKIARLREIFPEAFTENKVDFKRLQDILGENAAFNNEHYELSWAGKAPARKELQKQTSATLIPVQAKDPLKTGSNADASANIFIEGENLEVLRILQRSYFGKIKMIYIDPPYNTGNDSFVYPDDYSERRDEYQKRAGITNEEGLLNKQDLWKKNTRENGQFHSVWLSMMYPRLYLARNLLREDGVIFISIDDNEAANLKLLCDEIFGAENFVGNVVWQKKYAVSNDDPGIAPMHDYVLVFQKSDKFNRNLLPRTEKQLSRYTNLDNDPRGVWTSGEYVSGKSKTERPTLWYAIKHPKTGEDVWPDENAVWRYSKEKHEQMVAENRLHWGTNESYQKPRIKRFLSEIQDGVVPSTWWTFEDVGHNDEAQKETGELLGKKIFSTPKPIRFIRRILDIATLQNDIVLDFFAGSGATAQAILELNEADGGNRRFICVQLPELLDETSEAYKAGYRTIADICKARIEKVIAKIQAAREEAGINTSVFNDEITKQTPGFQSFCLAPSNFKQWRGDVEGKEAILAQLDLFRHSEKAGSDNDNMLVELLLKSGRPLTAKVEAAQINGQTVYSVEEGNMLIFFDEYNPAIKDYIHLQAPKKVVCLDRVFNNDDEALTNFQLGLKEAGIDLQII